MTSLSIDHARLSDALYLLVLKRLLDICLSSIILALTWPLFVGLAIAIALTSSGPVFFSQRRVGLRGETFWMLKFRSMYRDAEDRLAEFSGHSNRSGVCFKLEKDPRVTPVGRILRRFSLDELPQLFNVLRGDMSLVGPRPGLLSEVAAYPEHAHARHHVLPGITGLWQVSGRADIGFDEMISLDLEYVRGVSFLNDCTILIRTFGAVLAGKGAY